MDSIRLRFNSKFKLAAVAGLALLLTGAGLLEAQIPQPPAPLREFRGAWVATVRGVDWPYDPDQPTAKLQAQLLEIVEKAAALKLNAIVFQVRPAGDAVYQSTIEPWSPWLTGGMGKAPDPVWDPLDFMIKECHARGMELHAWFNPFRALAGKRFPAAGNHVSLQNPEWCSWYGVDQWMDPGEPGVRARSLAVILDVVRRYNVDGVHMDDYFYPYPLKANSGGVIPFQDDRTWNAYVAGGGKLDRSEWRRENVNTFVRDSYLAVKQEKAWVRYGLSPFGIWRPNYPEGYAKGALDPYEALAADSLKWLQQGWCDYMAPQLYWPTEPKNLSFPKLFDWWLTQNTARRHVWPGIASDRVLKDRQATEILRQISYTRERAPYMPPGHIHWNYSALGKNLGKLADVCKARAYEEFAVPPSASWLGTDTPTTAPMITLLPGQATWGMQDARLETFVKWWFVQTYENGKWVGKTLLPAETKTFAMKPEYRAIAVRALGNTGLAGPVAAR